MRIARIRLKNFAEALGAQAHFAMIGVTIVSGPNEAGKSSLMHALNVLIDHRDDSRKEEVRNTKPVNRDVGSEVDADIEIEPYRFTYFKRFHKDRETRLTIHVPRSENLSGRQAHERIHTTHLVMSPLDFMQRLAALVPRPRLHLIRLHRVLAPNAKMRAQVVAQEPEPLAQAAPPAEREPSCTRHRPVRLSWAKLFKRVFQIDMAHCPNCGGEQQMLTMCRTLMGDPDLIIIDEPTEGLATKLVEQVGRLLDEIAHRGIAMLLVELKLTIALKFS